MIKFKKLTKGAVIPEIAHEGDAGFDIRCIDDVEIYPCDQELIKTGIACAIPKGWAGYIVPRSGLAVKRRIDRRAGLIDSNYRGELKILLANDSSHMQRFKAGDRIAQMIVIPVMTDSVEVDDLDATERGEDGFGSTGVS